jgi:5-methyltetrahydropteroyltriglutamate--homocysteine methyltransferase
VVRAEARDLAAAGARFIQIDEPALSARPEEMALAIEAMRRVTKGLNARTVTHICYGDFEKIYPTVLKMPVDRIDLEMSNSGFDLLPYFKKYKFTKEIGYGVMDVHTHRVDTKNEVLARIKLALKYLTPEQTWIDPDCGLKTRTVEEALAQLKVMMAAVKEARKSL